MVIKMLGIFVQSRELLEEARAAKCYRDELDFVKEKVSEFVVLIWLKFNVVTLFQPTTSSLI